jgi:predicted DNA-binding protein
MDKTITIRTDDALREAIEERARAEGKTISALTREILEEAVAERPMELRTAHLRGRLRLRNKQVDSWRQQIRRRNWRS